MAYGTQAFRRYPFIDTRRPLPEATLSSYIGHALSDQGLGTRIATTRWPIKPYHCKRTGKSYLLWDNYLLHVRALSGEPSAKDVLDMYELKMQSGKQSKIDTHLRAGWTKKDEKCVFVA